MLTPVQHNVLAFVTDYWVEHGYAPTYREISAAVGCSLDYAHRCTVALEDRGYVSRLPYRFRNIEVLRDVAGNKFRATRRVARRNRKLTVPIFPTVCPDCGDQLVGVPCPRDHARAA